ncbi:hypothetical protein EMIHUDRAFT_241625 [Emiliania huxleyi CCMP1516]|uniref:ABC transmembrane type-1 domain-containing protein n=2 Tax=Emiliania huxleyi TaxID=2903 RepID=A0A0D3JCB3_EMIH1|nr:hypothetical protein EMIHUDRAFT_241625 [Emiliania huxleyi CCMP1516]EOD21148.1 hypothetical protein EMIHUDRAFT_241625 [Emiliania huxleyi CCMP1516]|eukprot:XP_005773577.1 hypothetical protein EMIHUDRAFT_241625 [Emiliania huxleyi CCMP1516]
MASKEFLTRTLAARGFLAWITQLLASCAWVASVFIYGGWELGDRLQLVAALSWTVSNAFAAPEAILPLLTAPEEQVAVEVRSVKSEADLSSIVLAFHVLARSGCCQCVQSCSVQ